MTKLYTEENRYDIQNCLSEDGYTGRTLYSVHVYGKGGERGAGAVRGRGGGAGNGERGVGSDTS